MLRAEEAAQVHAEAREHVDRVASVGGHGGSMGQEADRPPAERPSLLTHQAIEADFHGCPRG
jgi:hypothetical protein